MHILHDACQPNEQQMLSHCVLTYSKMKRTTQNVPILTSVSRQPNFHRQATLTISSENVIQLF